MKRTHEENINEISSRMKETKELFSKVESSLKDLREQFTITPKDQKYDLVCLNGRFSNTEYFLIPIETIDYRKYHNYDISFLLNHADSCGNPEADEFFSSEQVDFPEDSKEEKKRKRNLQKEKHHGMITISKNEPNQQHRFERTLTEARTNVDLFDKACDLFYSFNESRDGSVTPGILYTYLKEKEEVKNIFIRNVYSWTNVL